MLDASHAVIGAALAQLVPDPALGLPLAVALHFGGDLVPHWDMRTRHVDRSTFKTIIYSLTDAGIGYALGFILFNQSVPPLYLMAMMFASQLPDWIEAPYHVFGWNFPPFSWIKRLQSRWHHKQDLPWGLVWQLIIVAAVVLLAKL